MSRAPAKGRTRQKDTRVATIRNQSTTISTNAHPPKCHAKKSQLQSALNESCSKNSESAARFACIPPQCQTSQAEMAIRAYRMIQTGPKTDEGGAHDGRRSSP